MGWVLKDSTTIDGEVYLIGTTPPPEVAARVGEHLRVEVDHGGSQVDQVVEQEPNPFVLQETEKDGEGLYLDPGSSSDPADPDSGAAEPVAPSGTPQPPPQGGPKGSAKAWHEYAAAVGVEVDADAKRDDVIDAVKAAGKSVE